MTNEIKRKRAGLQLSIGWQWKIIIVEWWRSMRAANFRLQWRRETCQCTYSPVTATCELLLPTYRRKMCVCATRTISEKGTQQHEHLSAWISRSSSSTSSEEKHFRQQQQKILRHAFCLATETGHTHKRNASISRVPFLFTFSQWHMPHIYIYIYKWAQQITRTWNIGQCHNNIFFVSYDSFLFFRCCLLAHSL